MLTRQLLYYLHQTSLSCSLINSYKRNSQTTSIVINNSIENTSNSQRAFYKQFSEFFIAIISTFYILLYPLLYFSILTMKIIDFLVLINNHFNFYNTILIYLIVKKMLNMHFLNLTFIYVLQNLTYSIQKKIKFFFEKKKSSGAQSRFSWVAYYRIVVIIHLMPLVVVFQFFNFFFLRILKSTDQYRINEIYNC